MRQAFGVRRILAGFRYWTRIEFVIETEQDAAENCGQQQVGVHVGARHAVLDTRRRAVLVRDADGGAAMAETPCQVDRRKARGHLISTR